MYLNNLMEEKNMTCADLSRLSEVPESTLRDILNGKAQIDRCEAGTIYSIADALDTTVEDILLGYWTYMLGDEDLDETEENILHDSRSLALFYHLVNAVQAMPKDEDVEGEDDYDLAFFCLVSMVKKGNHIEKLYDIGSYREALFLLGLIDYLSPKLGIELDERYEKYRHYRLDRPVYPLWVFEMSEDVNDDQMYKKYVELYAIPELSRFNIFMTEEDIIPSED